MNCKPGDLAVVIRSSSGYHNHHIGKILKVVAPSDRHPYAWITEPKLYWLDTHSVIHWKDESLRPIRDPGEDAVDETLQWLPVPSPRPPGAPHELHLRHRFIGVHSLCVVVVMVRYFP